MQQFVYPQQIPYTKPQASVGAVNIQIYNPTATPNTSAVQGQAAPLYPYSNFYAAQPSKVQYPINYTNNFIQHPQLQQKDFAQNQIQPSLGTGANSSIPTTLQKEAVAPVTVDTQKEALLKPAAPDLKKEAVSDTKTEKKDDKKKKPKVPLTDEYLKTLENYMNNNSAKIRLMGIQEVLERFKEDEKRKSDPALTALLNKALKDQYNSVRFLALTAIELGYAKGNDETISILQQIQNMKENYGDDALLASKALLRIAGEQQTA